MALAALVQKMKSKKQATARSAFGHYLEAVKELASGKEIDADEAGHIINVAGRDESALERDVNLQQQRNAWHSQLMQNKQAVQDRYQAERDLAAAQRALQEAYDKLMPAADAAQRRIDAADYSFMTTTQAEAWLCDPANILDAELLERETALNAKLRECQIELRPLLIDREHKRTALIGAEQRLSQLRGRDKDDWQAWGITDFFFQNKDIKAAQERVDDVRDQLSQLEQAIHPRQQVQAKLQAELNSIHQEKLKP
jgi:hypothetical protein